MTRRLVGKPGGASIGITIGDMTTTRVPGEYALVSWCSTRSTTSRPRTPRSPALKTLPPTCDRAAVSSSRSVSLHCDVSHPARTPCPSTSTPTAQVAASPASTATTSSASRSPRTTCRSLKAAGVPDDSVPVCVASGAGPRGSNRRIAARASLGRLVTCAFHRRQRQARVGLDQANRSRRRSPDRLGRPAPGADRGPGS